jgi:NAD(P)-dependent dehydrogenase (short-subunit alcohol dehydrogenase family)
MQVEGTTAIVSGGASGLGLAAVRQLLERDARVVIFDLPTSHGDVVAKELGPEATFVPGDVTDSKSVQRAVAAAQERGGPRILVHTAGVGGPMRIVDRDGQPGDLATYERVIRINLVGTFNVLRHVAASMSRLDPLGEERGVCILTASIAAFDGRIGQVHYASSKGGVVGLTLPAARDLASRLIRVVTIAPGTFDTPLLGRLPEEIREQLGAATPHPARLGTGDEYAALALHVVDNPMLNGETIRLDGALRMTPR